ncbi:thrombospondin type 3 repeat-containing protein [Paraliobacillus sp. X-1268]|uniref:thrombospondin type 3 repeat-containing protein n=1 Tax=Paraliobacillus sp. X-1268 TaxID=2213193 RepID=UPI000E3E24C6|nr:thrombospondin type 3 repeat-containing protein [Paraliobacillus sp. X-1268]
MKRKLKIILLLTTAIFILFPGVSAFAYEGGVLNEPSSSHQMGNPSYATDDDTNTFAYGDSCCTSSRITYELENVETITEYYLMFSGSSLSIGFYDSDMNLLQRISVENNGRIAIMPPQSNVKTIQLAGIRHGTDVREFDVYTSDSPPPDSDGDGIPDLEDDYPEDPNNGDQDGDGIPDSEDKYPEDPTNTPPPVGEVINLELEAQFDRVDLSWTLPDSDRLAHVNIYRDEITETSMLQKIMGVSVAHAATTEIFETNGTYFNDLTVEPEAEYEYTVTTTDTDGIESNGVTATTGTPKEPMINLRDMELPFGIGDLISSGNALLALVGGFILLALSFIFVPKLIKLIRGSIREKGIKRDEHGNRIHFQSKKAKAYQAKEKQERVREKRLRGREKREREQGLKRDEHGNRIHFQSKKAKAHLEKSIKEMKPPRGRLQRPKREPKQTRQPREPRKGRRSN